MATDHVLIVLHLSHGTCTWKINTTTTADLTNASVDNIAPTVTDGNISISGGTYKIGDTVRFTSLSPYRIKISGRTKHFINAFGEEVIIDNAEKALSKACLETNALVKDYTACPIYFDKDEPGAHEWIIEFEKQPKEFERFIDILDNTLREVNSDYDAKRFKDMALKRPKVHIAPQGLFYDWLKENDKLGGQHKIPRLSNERTHLEELLKMQLMHI